MVENPGSTNSGNCNATLNRFINKGISSRCIQVYFIHDISGLRWFQDENNLLSNPSSNLQSVLKCRYLCYKEVLISLLDGG
jgi:hypothetical protein